ncbi:hypothetical protein BGX30_007214, partial [Mortierella sp. GBA39]
MVRQRQDSFISNLTGKTRQYLPEVVNQYMKNWKINPSPGQEADKDVVQNGTDITNLYFELSADFYETGVLGAPVDCVHYWATCRSGLHALIDSSKCGDVLEIRFPPKFPPVIDPTTIVGAGQSI